MSDDLPLNAEDIAEIAAIIEASPYRELDLSTRRFRLRLARADGAETGLTQEWQWAGSGPEAAVTPEGEHTADPDAVAAPLPGTFYHAPQPGAAPFVVVGDAVGPETVVGIVETMKLMNPIHAGRAGTVVEVLAPNAAMVAKGQPLFRLA